MARKKDKFSVSILLAFGLIYTCCQYILNLLKGGMYVTRKKQRGKVFEHNPIF
jgi:hypothetical protein